MMRCRFFALMVVFSFFIIFPPVAGAVEIDLSNAGIRIVDSDTINIYRVNVPGVGIFGATFDWDSDSNQWVLAGAVQSPSFSEQVLPLFTQNNVWAPNTLACNAPGCHTGIGSAHDLDMGTYEGIMLGADAGEEPIVFPGDASESPLRKRIRNNRMPTGIPASAPRNGPNNEVFIVEDWINAGAPNGAFTDRGGASKTFDRDVLPLFTGSNVWAPNTLACNAPGCHTGIGSAHDLDMGTYEGIMLGADAGEEPIVIPGNASESDLRKRIRNNRMPTGISASAPRNGPNNEVRFIADWINAGAPNN